MRIWITLLSIAITLVVVPNAHAVSDPQSDTPTPLVDLVEASATTQGRGVRIRYTFASVPSILTRPCVRVGLQETACLNADRKTMQLGNRRIWAHTTVSNTVITVWVRGSYVGLRPAATRTIALSASLHSRMGACARRPCVDRVARFSLRLRPLTRCQRVQARSYTHGSRRLKRVALTFDDGPHGIYTSRILSTLARYKVPATFYINGIHVSANRSLVKRMYRDGHEVANHSWGHEIGPSNSSILRTNRAIRSAIPWIPCTMRPPYGSTMNNLVSRMSGLGLATILWDVDTLDWKHPDARRIARVGSSGVNGSIVLMHDGGGHRATTAAALPAIIQSYQRRGYELVTVDELLGFVATR